MTLSDILTDWKFWAFLVSFVALVLSQLPPIHIMIRKANLDLEIYSRIFVTHKVGNPNIQAQIILRNIGGKTLRINKIQAKIFRNGEEIMNLPAQTYVADPKDNLPVLLTSFVMKPDEEWSYMTTFLQYFDRNENKVYREAEMNLKNEINRLVREMTETDIAIASDDFVVSFYDLFDKKFNWFSGDYVLEIGVVTNIPKASACKQYRFTIFESITDDLTKQKNEYATGAGIYLDSTTPFGSWIEIEEKIG